jgi:hypothetical protein
MTKPPLFSDHEARTLSVMHIAWLTGLLVFVGMVFYLNQGVRGKVAEIPDFIRYLSYGVAGLSVMNWMASKALFQNLLSTAIRKHARGEIDASGLKTATRIAYLVKVALVETPALLGLFTLVWIVFLPCDILLAPRYCLLNLVAVAVFYLEMLLNFPTQARLEFVLREMGYGEEVRQNP